MRDLRKLLGGSGIVAFATVLALAGCGGSAAPADAPADDAAATEEAAETKDAATLKQEEGVAKAEEAKHWRTAEETMESTSTYMTTDENGNTEKYSGTSSTATTYEFDDKGNVIKKVATSTNSYGENTDITEETTTYTRDENGWPTKAEKTSKSTFTYPDGMGGTQESENSETSETEYTYAYDDDGRVTEVSIAGDNASSMTFTYYEDGTVATRSRTSSYTSYSSDGEEREIKSETLSEYNDQGMLIRQVSTTTGEEDCKQHDVEYIFDGFGTIVSTVHTYTYDDDSQGTETRTEEIEKNEDGFVTKVTTTFEGDGRHVNERWYAHSTIEEVIMPDGSVQATTYAIGDNGEREAGETQTYDGPYCVEENTYDEQGNQLTYTSTYYDGSVDKGEYTYDESGNNTKTVYTSPDGSVQTYTYTYDGNGNQTSMQVDGSDYDTKYTYSYTHFDEISDYVQTFGDLRYWLEQ